LKHFVSNQQVRDRALKRGGGVRFVTLEVETEDGPAALEPATHQTPERLFDRKWALAVITEAMGRVATEYRRGGLAQQFEVLKPYLTGDTTEHLPVFAARLGKSEGATRVLVFRLRNRFRRLIRAVIADTVINLDQVETELRHLEAVLRDD
jgi:RNA polymerase sigma-70 factor (ECF subfamily)